MMNRKLLKAFPYLAFCVGWSYIDNFDTEKTKAKAFNKGLSLSQKFKSYSAWDNYVEPLIVRQFSFIFGVSNSFIKGLISDNVGDNEVIDETLEEMKKEIEDDLNDIKKHT
jgi:hypothetical protein